MLEEKKTDGGDGCPRRVGGRSRHEGARATSIVRPLSPACVLSLPSLCPSVSFVCVRSLARPCRVRGAVTAPTKARGGQGGHAASACTPGNAARRGGQPHRGECKTRRSLPKKASARRDGKKGEHTSTQSRNEERGNEGNEKGARKGDKNVGVVQTNRWRERGDEGREGDGNSRHKRNEQREGEEKRRKRRTERGSCNAPPLHTDNDASGGKR